MIGTARDACEALQLRRYPNLHFFGPKGFEAALRFIRCFDVAIIPHRREAWGAHGHPPELYVYAALGIPVVMNKVEEIGLPRGRIDIAAGSEELLGMLDAAVARRAISVRTNRLLSAISGRSPGQNVSRTCSATACGSCTRDRPSSKGSGKSAGWVRSAGSQAETTMPHERARRWRDVRARDSD